MVLALSNFLLFPDSPRVCRKYSVSFTISFCEWMRNSFDLTVVARLSTDLLIAGVWIDVLSSSVYFLGMERISRALATGHRTVLVVDNLEKK